MDVEGLYDLLIDARKYLLAVTPNYFLNNTWAQDSTFLFVGVIVESIIMCLAPLLFKYNRLTNGAHKDALFYSGLISVIPAVIAFFLGLPFHHTDRLWSFFSFLISSICGSSAVLLMLMKTGSDEETGYYYRSIGFAVAICNFVCAFYYRSAIKIFPFATGLMCYNVGSTILIFHETKRQFQ